MKKLILGFIATIIFAINSNAQDKNFDSFFTSNEFSILSKKFLISKENIDVKNYASIDHDSKLYKIYRVLVLKDNIRNFITFFSDDNGKSYGLAFEKIDMKENKAVHFDEYGNTYAIFNISKSGTSYSFNISKELPPPSNGLLNKKSPCIAKTYQTLKKACQSDDFCDMMCDLTPSCLPMLYAWALIYCDRKN